MKKRENEETDWEAIWQSLTRVEDFMINWNDFLFVSLLTLDGGKTKSFQLPFYDYYARRRRRRLSITRLNNNNQGARCRWLIIMSPLKEFICFWWAAKIDFSPSCRTQKCVHVGDDAEQTVQWQMDNCPLKPLPRRRESTTKLFPRPSNKHRPCSRWRRPSRQHFGEEEKIKINFTRMSGHRQTRHDSSLLSGACLHKYCVWNEITGVSFFGFLFLGFWFFKRFLPTTVSARILFFVASHSQTCLLTRERLAVVRGNSISSLFVHNEIDLCEHCKQTLWASMTKKTSFCFRSAREESLFSELKWFAFRFECVDFHSEQDERQVSWKISFKSQSIRNERKSLRRSLLTMRNVSESDESFPLALLRNVSQFSSIVLRGKGASVGGKHDWT